MSNGTSASRFAATYHLHWSKVCIKSLWTVVWFSQIVYFIRDYQCLCKQLPKLVKLQKLCSMPSCLMNVDQNYGQKWPPKGVSVHTNKQFPVLFCLFYLWCGIGCPLDDSHGGNTQFAKITQLSTDFWYKLYKVWHIFPSAATKFLTIWSAANRDYNLYYVIRSTFSP